MRERAQKEKRQDKSVKREEKKRAKEDRKNNSLDGIDPDLIGIFPGPHNRPIEWKETLLWIIQKLGAKKLN